MTSIKELQDITTRLAREQESGTTPTQKPNQSYLAAAEFLGVTELSLLIRAFVHYENSMDHWGMGSATPTPLFIRLLRNKDPSLAGEIIAWSFRVSRNPYLPFGTRNWHRHIAGSVEHYRELVRESQERQAAYERKQQEAKALRRVQRATEHRKRLDQQQTSSIIRKGLIESLRGLSHRDLLQTVAEDKVHPPYYYPEEYTEIEDNELSTFSLDNQKLLLRKLGHAPRGGWRRLAVRLRKRLNIT